MHRDIATPQPRENHRQTLRADVAVVGGGLAGVCAAITAARAGASVALIQDRPVLGGNASSEVRMWAVGATSHMGNNNRWAREGGVIDEILLENLYRNPDGNVLILDSILLEKVTEEPNITLLLNSAVFAIAKKDSRTIERVEAFCSQNSTHYIIEASVFCDASGDGIVGHLAGAAYRVGGEAQSEYGEKIAGEAETEDVLGHTLYFYSKSAGKKVAYVPPSFALKDITAIPRYKVINSTDQGCRFWWIEYGGLRDTIYETEEIKWELWRIIYGVWDYIKNSGAFADVDDLTLEWVGTIPGKRESRRFVGHYTLTQRDIVEQRDFEDTVAYGGWAIDHHPPEGVYGTAPACEQWHTKGIYPIPYRCFISKDIDNLIFAGRTISVSHIAFGSTRVMLTCAFGGQAAGMAAAMCAEHNIVASDILEPARMHDLQQRLGRMGHSLPHLRLSPQDNLATQATIGPSSTYSLSQLPADGPWLSLETAMAQLLPLTAEVAYCFEVTLRAKCATTLHCELRASEKPNNYTPDLIIERVEIPLKKGEQSVQIQFSQGLPSEQYGFLTLLANADIEVKMSEARLTGILSVFNKASPAVSNYGRQEPPDDIGIDIFEFWTPARRPQGHNIALKVAPALACYAPEVVTNGLTRPTLCTNAWAAALDDNSPQITLRWPSPQSLREVTLYFDTDFDHGMESTLREHPEPVTPFCVRDYIIRAADGRVLHEAKGNYQTINRIVFADIVETDALTIEFQHPSPHTPATLFQIICQ